MVKVEWTNPHIWVYVDMKDDKGAVVRWQCEGGSPNTLTRQGWSKDSLKQGDQVAIDGYRAKDGSNTCNSSAVTLADGRGYLPDPPPKASDETRTGSSLFLS